MPLEAAGAHYRAQRSLARRAALAAGEIWAGFANADLDRSWRQASDRLLVLTSVAQRQAALRADSYVANVLDEQGIASDAAGSVNPTAFAGAASDGRDLGTLLYQPVITTKVALTTGAQMPEAMAAGQAALLRIVATQVQDAGRAAVGVGVAARRRVGWVRMLQTPSCARCAVLAGKFFRWNQGFQRHPLCDCQHIPTAESAAGDLTVDPRAAIEAGQVTGLSKSDLKAITEDGADVGQVVNARRGMRAGGITTRGSQRLTPEAIYEQADSREHALRLLTDHGYLA